MLGDDPLRKLGLSFFLFGLINNISLYLPPLNHSHSPLCAYTLRRP